MNALKIDGAPTLVIGIGNDSRADDGLGWAFVEKLEASGKFQGHLQYRYQLQIEDAEHITHYRKIVFVDAFRGPIAAGFQWKEILPESAFYFTTHLLLPENILYLAQALYGYHPRAFRLSIRGIDWKLADGMSPVAAENLEAAFQFYLQLDKSHGGI